MKKLLLIAPFLLFTVSCKETKEDKIAREWQAISLESPTMDEKIKEQEAFIDTLGKSTTPEQNDSIYHTRNVDSLREALRNELAEFRGMQDHAVKNTWFHFRKDGTALMNFSGQDDSTKWYFDDEGALILDEMKMKGTGSKLKMDVVQLEDTVLKLRFTEDGLTSTVTFEPKKK